MIIDLFVYIFVSSAELLHAALMANHSLCLAEVELLVLTRALYLLIGPELHYFEEIHKYNNVWS